MLKSEKLPCYTCPVYFTSHPVHCIPLPTPALFGFAKTHTRKQFLEQHAFSHLGPVTWNKLLCSGRYAPADSSVQNQTIPLSPWTRLLSSWNQLMIIPLLTCLSSGVVLTQLPAWRQRRCVHRGRARTLIVVV